MPAAPAPLHPALLPGATGVRRAALGEAVLPALLQRVQGPCDHHVWGELPSLACALHEPQTVGRPVWLPSTCPLQWARGGPHCGRDPTCPLSPQHTFCRRCALKSGRTLSAQARPPGSPAAGRSLWGGPPGAQHWWRPLVLLQWQFLGQHSGQARRPRWRAWTRPLGAAPAVRAAGLAGSGLASGLLHTLSPAPRHYPRLPGPRRGLLTQCSSLPVLEAPEGEGR